MATLSGTVEDIFWGRRVLPLGSLTLVVIVMPSMTRSLTHDGECLHSTPCFNTADT